MAEDLKIVSYNFLSAGTFTITGGTPDTNYPSSRLYDWSKNFLWLLETGSSIEAAEDITLHLDALSAVDVDTLFISNHNFSGFDMTWEYSTDNVAWTNVIAPWTQADNDDIILEASSVLNARYWRITIDASDPECGEIILGEALPFSIRDRPLPSHSRKANVLWSPSVSGQERGIKFGDERRIRRYTFRLNAADLLDMQQVFEDTDGFSQPVLIKDKDDAWFLVRFEAPPSEDFLFTGNLLTEVDLTFIEMI